MREHKVNIIWKDAYKKRFVFALRNQEHVAPFAKLVCVSRNILMFFIWTNKIFLSSVHEFYCCFLSIYMQDVFYKLKNIIY